MHQAYNHRFKQNTYSPPGTIRVNMRCDDSFSHVIDHHAHSLSHLASDPMLISLSIEHGPGWQLEYWLIFVYMFVFYFIRYPQPLHLSTFSINIRVLRLSHRLKAYLLSWTRMYMTRIAGPVPQVDSTSTKMELPSDLLCQPQHYFKRNHNNEHHQQQQRHAVMWCLQRCCWCDVCAYGWWSLLIFSLISCEYRNWFELSLF